MFQGLAVRDIMSSWFPLTLTVIICSVYLSYQWHASNSVQM